MKVRALLVAWLAASAVASATPLDPYPELGDSTSITPSFGHLESQFIVSELFRAERQSGPVAPSGGSPAPLLESAFALSGSACVIAMIRRRAHRQSSHRRRRADRRRKMAYI